MQLTKKGKEANDRWLKGRTWGLRLYQERYDGLLFTTKLNIEAPSIPVRPNKEVTGDPHKLPKPKPMAPTQVGPTTVMTPNIQETLPPGPSELALLTAYQ